MGGPHNFIFSINLVGNGAVISNYVGICRT